MTNNFFVLFVLLTCIPLIICEGLDVIDDFCCELSCCCDCWVLELYGFKFDVRMVLLLILLLIVDDADDIDIAEANEIPLVPTSVLKRLAYVFGSGCVMIGTTVQYIKL